MIIIININMQSIFINTETKKNKSNDNFKVYVEIWDINTSRKYERTIQRRTIW